MSFDKLYRSIFSFGNNKNKDQEALAEICRLVTSLAEDINALRETLIDNSELEATYTKKRIQQRLRTHDSSGASLSPKTLSDFEVENKRFFKDQLNLGDDKVDELLEKIERLSELT